ncbi:MAG: tripartite tricarboxylate transporter TctB family protein [Burkholderiales bacterium]
MSSEANPMAEQGGTDETPVSARADFLSALVWIAFGIIIVLASWNMDRLESQGAKIYTAPGLYPGIVGGVLVAFGLLLALRALRAGGHRLAATPWSLSASARAMWLRVGGFLVLALAYAAGVVGRAGIPFWLATLVFVTGCILIFEAQKRRARGETVRGIVVALAMGAGTALLVSYVFQELFLVRLP